MRGLGAPAISCGPRSDNHPPASDISPCTRSTAAVHSLVSCVGTHMPQSSPLASTTVHDCHVGGAASCARPPAPAARGSADRTHELLLSSAAG
eukprot:6214011-Pyramimonas_sp.AAC.1